MKRPVIPPDVAARMPRPVLTERTSKEVKRRQLVACAPIVAGLFVVAAGSLIQSGWTMAAGGAVACVGVVMLAWANTVAWWRHG